MGRHWTDGIAHARRNNATGGDKDDADIATLVRMLMRDDPMHEAVLTMARNRIARLSYENAVLRYKLERIAEQAIDGDPKMAEMIHDAGYEDSSEFAWEEAFASVVIEARAGLEHIQSDQQGLFVYAGNGPASAPSEENT